MRRALLAALVPVVALALAAPASARSRCPTTHVVKRSSEAVIFTRKVTRGGERTLYYGCLHRVRKIYRLTQVGDYGYNIVHPRTIRLSGSFVAYEQDWLSGAGDATNTMSVRSLRTGVVLHQAEVSRRGSDLGDRTRSVVLKRNGSVAWIAQSTRFEVRAMDASTIRNTGRVAADRPRLLDVGADVDPSSLRLSSDRRRVSWVRAGARKSAPLP